MLVAVKQRKRRVENKGGERERGKDRDIQQVRERGREIERMRRVVGNPSCNWRRVVLQWPQ